MNVRPGSKVGHVTSVTRGTSCRKESVCVSIDDTDSDTHSHMLCVITTGVCVYMFLPPACDDDCTGILLDDLQKIHNHFLSAKPGSVAMATHRQLVLLEKQSRDVQVKDA